MGFNNPHIQRRGGWLSVETNWVNTGKDVAYEVNRNRRVSICTVTMDRSDLAKECLGPSLARADYNYELLVWDNHSTEDPKVIDYVASLKPKWHHLHHENIGYAKAVNQLLLRASGSDYFCVLDPDLSMPNRWLSRLISYYEAIPNSGLVAYYCVLNRVPESEINGKRVHTQDVYGIKFFGREVLEKVGYFYEGYGRYGIEDVDLNVRVINSGFTSYYIGDNWECSHRQYDSVDYRKFKDDSLREAVAIYNRERGPLYEKGLELYQPPPERICD